MSCQRCKGGLGEEHFLQPMTKGPSRTICGVCYNRLTAPPRYTTFQALLRTLAFSGVAAVLCGFVAALPIAIFTLNTAIVWLLLGVVMGRAVVIASEDRGNWYYRLIGLGSTWCAIGLSWLFCLFIWMTFGFPQDHEEKAPISNTALVSMLKPSKTPAPEVSATPGASATPAASAAPAPGKAEPEGPEPSLAVKAVVVTILSLLVVVAGPIFVAFASPISILIYFFAMHTTWKTCARESRELERVGPPTEPEKTDWSRPGDEG